MDLLAAMPEVLVLEEDVQMEQVAEAVPAAAQLKVQAAAVTLAQIAVEPEEEVAALMEQQP